MNEPAEINDRMLKMKVPQVHQASIRHPRQYQGPDLLLASMFDDGGLQLVSTDLDEEKRLNWIPLPKRLMTMNTEEQIADTAHLSSMIARPDDILESEQLLWKQEGLRLLDINDDSDEELEMSDDPDIFMKPELASRVPQKRVHEVGDALMTTAKQPKLQHDWGTLVAPAITSIQKEHVPISPALPGATRDPRLQRRLAQKLSVLKSKDNLPSLAPSSPELSLCSDPAKKTTKSTLSPFSTTGSLASFLNLRSDKFKKSASDNRLIPSDMSNDPIEASQMTFTCLDKEFAEQSIEVPTTPTYCLAASAASSPIPRVEQLCEPRTIVIDQAILKNHSLIKMLDSADNGRLTTIYRDLHSGPDIILNPMTCILFSNLQALKQRSLPGQGQAHAEGAVQNRIKLLAADFELVIILLPISASLTGPTAEAQTFDMASFASYCNTASCKMDNGHVTPQWVIIDDVTVQSRAIDPTCAWTWSFIARYAFKDTSLLSPSHSIPQCVPQPSCFIEDKTLWELFLCKAGLNSMAAQIVLGMLKKDPNQPDQRREHTAEDHRFGLSRSINMAADERIHMFGELIGVKAMQRMNAVFEAKWS